MQAYSYDEAASWRFFAFLSHYRKRNSVALGFLRSNMGSFHLYAGRKIAALYISNPCSEG